MKKNILVFIFFYIMTGSLLVFSKTTLEQGLEALLLEQFPTVSIATKTEESLVGSSGTVYVITEQDIKRYGWRDLQQILKAIPNMDLMWQYNWLNGGQRGFTGNFSGTLLLIDGREVQNLLASEAFMTWDFPSNRIKRVEVLQGPNSTLYGGNATQGVINVITKFGDKGDKDLTEAEIVEGQVGTESVAGVYKRNDLNKDWELGFSASTFKTDQDWPELARFASNDNLFSRDLVRDPLRDHRLKYFNLKEQTWTADTYARYKDVYAGYDLFKEDNSSGLEYVRYDYNRDETKRGFRQAYVGIKHDFSENLNTFAEYQNVSEDELWHVEQLANPLTATSYDHAFFDINAQTIQNTRRDLIKGQVSWKMNENNHLIAGYEYWKLKIDDLLYQTNALYPNAGSENLAEGWPVDKEICIKQSLFVQDTMSFIPDKLKLTAGLRYNKQDYTNSSYLPRTSLVYQPTPDSALKVTYGKAFRPPNIFEFMNIQNNTLDSQEMDMYEINYTQNINLSGVNLYNILAIYTMEASNLYQKVWVGGGATQLQGWRTDVGGSFQISGIEDMIRISLNKFSGFAGFRYIDPDKTLIAGQKIVADVPKTKLKLGISYEFLKTLNASLFVDHWDKVLTDANRYQVSGTEVYTVPSWTCVDLNINVGEFKLAEMQANFSFSVENLFDTTYYHANVRAASPVQFLQPPRTCYLKASFQV